MARPPEVEEGLAPVISLRTFRDQIQQGPPEYEDVDHLSFHQARGMLMGLHGPPIPRVLYVVSRMVDTPSKVIGYADEHQWLYGASINRQEQDRLLEDLEAEPEDIDQKLRAPLKRLLLTSLIAEHVLESCGFEIPESGISNANAGKPVIRIKYEEEPVRYMDFMRKRAASGLGLLAIAGQRPQLEESIKNYLGFTLGRRFETVRSRTAGRRAVEVKEGKNGIVDGGFIAFCNPLDRFELRNIKPPTHGIE